MHSRLGVFMLQLPLVLKDIVAGAEREA